MKYLIHSVLLLSAYTLFWGCLSDTEKKRETPKNIETESQTGVFKDSWSKKNWVAQSAYDEEGNAPSKAKFTSTVSKTGTQAIFIKDKDDKVRALTLSVIEDNEPEIMEVNERSTALALLLLTPGIATAEPKESSKRVKDIQKYPEFDSIVAFLKEHQTSTPLSDFIRPKKESDISEQWAKLFSRFLEKWSVDNDMGILSLLKPSASSNLKIGPTVGKFSVKLKDSSNIKKTKIEIANQSWRFARAYRLGTQKDAALGSIKSYDLGSATTFSITSTATMSVGSPATQEDIINYKDYPSIDYWVVGPGFQSGIIEKDQPVEIRRAIAKDGVIDLYGKTILLNALLPIGDVLMGGGSLVVEVASGFSNLWTGIANTPNILNLVGQLTKMESTTDVMEAAKTLSDITLAIMGSDPFINLLKKAGYATAATTGGGVLTVIGALMGAVNFTLTAATYFLYPKVEVVKTSYQASTATSQGPVDLIKTKVVTLINKSEKIETISAGYHLLHVIGLLEYNGSKSFTNLNARVVVFNSAGDSVGLGLTTDWWPIKSFPFGPKDRLAFKGAIILKDKSYEKTEVRVFGNESTDIHERGLFEIRTHIFINEKTPDPSKGIRRSVQIYPFMKNISSQEQVMDKLFYQMLFYDENHNLINLTHNFISSKKTFPVGEILRQSPLSTTMPDDQIRFEFRACSDNPWIASKSVDYGKVTLKKIRKKMYQDTCNNVPCVRYYGEIFNNSNHSISNISLQSAGTSTIGGSRLLKPNEKEFYWGVFHNSTLSDDSLEVKSTLSASFEISIDSVVGSEAFKIIKSGTGTKQEPFQISVTNTLSDTLKDVNILYLAFKKNGNIQFSSSGRITKMAPNESKEDKFWVDEPNGELKVNVHGLINRW